MKKRSKLYIKANTEERSFTYSGISFSEFIQYLDNPLDNLLLAKGDYMGNAQAHHFELLEGATEIRALAEGGIWGLVAVVGITAAVLLFQFLRWRKTWVTLDGNLIIIERNTLNRIHNTIAVENLSAVNVERNLFERIVGTARIKMDTSSMTTADKTDVSLVFREDKAIAFRQAVISRMNQAKGTAAEENLAEDIRPDMVPESIAESGNVFSYRAWDMAKHSFYSMSIINLLIVVGGIASSVWYRTSEYYEPGAVLEHAGAIIPVLLVFVSAAYGLIKKYIIYYNFIICLDIH